MNERTGGHNTSCCGCSGRLEDCLHCTIAMLSVCLLYKHCVPLFKWGRILVGTLVHTSSPIGSLAIGYLYLGRSPLSGVSSPPLVLCFTEHLPCDCMGRQQPSSRSSPAQPRTTCAGCGPEQDGGSTCELCHDPGLPGYIF